MKNQLLIHYRDFSEKNTPWVLYTNPDGINLGDLLQYLPAILPTTNPVLRFTFRTEEKEKTIHYFLDKGVFQEKPWCVLLGQEKKKIKTIEEAIKFLSFFQNIEDRMMFVMSLKLRPVAKTFLSLIEQHKIQNGFSTIVPFWRSSNSLIEWMLGVVPDSLTRKEIRQPFYNVYYCFNNKELTQEDYVELQLINQVLFGTLSSLKRNRTGYFEYTNNGLTAVKLIEEINLWYFCLTDDDLYNIFVKKRKI
jgi:hypothetical protein